jgi:hypothetical protein
MLGDELLVQNILHVSGVEERVFDAVDLEERRGLVRRAEKDF